jgi:hypothetical protein
MIWSVRLMHAARGGNSFLIAPTENECLHYYCAHTLLNTHTHTHTHYIHTYIFMDSQPSVAAVVPVPYFLFL